MFLKSLKQQLTTVLVCSILDIHYGTMFMFFFDTCACCKLSTRTGIYYGSMFPFSSCDDVMDILAPKYEVVGFSRFHPFLHAMHTLHRAHYWELRTRHKHTRLVSTLTI